MMPYLGLLTFDTVLAVLAFDHGLDQGCSVAERWKSMFSHKSLHIKEIQDSVSPPVTMLRLTVVSMLWVSYDQGSRISIPWRRVYSYCMC